MGDIGLKLKEPKELVSFHEVLFLWEYSSLSCLRGVRELRMSSIGRNWSWWLCRVTC
jgi:hypothetical protein